MLHFFFFNDTATTEIYTLSLTTLFRSRIRAAGDGDHGGEFCVAESSKPADNGHEKRSEEHTSELQSQSNLVCRLLLEKKKCDRLDLLRQIELLCRACVSPLRSCPGGAV